MVDYDCFDVCHHLLYNSYNYPIDNHDQDDDEVVTLCLLVSPSPVPESGQDGSTNSDGIDSDSKQNSTEVKGKVEPKSKKDNNRSPGRLLPKHAVAMLKEWILSPEHFSFPHPTDEEKKILMEKLA